MSSYDRRPRVTAVLGPTNTGKTYLAIERMLDHETGMIGFPLRLLARENYDKVVAIKGRRHVALVTGEEKILPPSAKYFICTVESMPLDREVQFLAVDEVQMCADPERGHVFTDRMLRARGTVLTMFLGADTMRGLLRKLVPDAEFISRPRLSQLTYVGPRKISRLPRRSAIVAFSANEVYAVAELLRRQRGGAAVVLGALSPRTRNAQVAMYQAGEVDYLVATDAIGMGLNMNVDHVAFRSLKKFDGRVHRRLTTSEIAQIAGRAGRHMTNGGFGPLAELGPFDEDVVEAIENHQFAPLTSVQWRNAQLDFRSLLGLQRSLDASPPRPELIRARVADDHRSLVALARDPDMAALAVHPEAIRVLWDVCQIPDFRKTMDEAHTRLLARIYAYLMRPEARLPTDWIADQMARLDRPDGDIDTLMARIAHIRTWTYVSHRADWLDDAGHWQERARTVENRLSDALHERLTQRFVDRRATALIRARGKDNLFAVVDSEGSLSVEGQHVGHLDGLRFTPDATDTGEERKALMAAANRTLQREIGRRVAALNADPNTAFSLRDDAAIIWRGAVIARLRGDDHPLAPRMDILAHGAISPERRDQARARLSRWLNARIAEDLTPLLALRDADIDGPGRGLAYQLVEALGSLPRKSAAPLIRAVTGENRKALRRLGVRIGMESVYLPVLIKPRPARLRAMLWQVHKDEAVRPTPIPGLISLTPETDAIEGFYEASGYRLIGGRAVRIDILDRLAVMLLRLARRGPFELSHEILSLLGLSAEHAMPVIAALGYRLRETDDGPRLAPARNKRGAQENTPKSKSKNRPSPENSRPRRHPVDPNSPFAKLQELRIAK
jgi:ATP-dependent RNA helicase SUPV3L1/SUV3